MGLSIERKLQIGLIFGLLIPVVLTSGCLFSDQDDFGGVYVITPLNIDELANISMEEMIKKYEKMGSENSNILTDLGDAKRYLGIKKMIPMGQLFIDIEDYREYEEHSEDDIRFICTLHGEEFRKEKSEIYNKYKITIEDEVSLLFEEMNWTLKKDRMDYYHATIYADSFTFIY
jgi:hypothetical protein